MTAGRRARAPGTAGESTSDAGRVRRSPYGSIIRLAASARTRLLAPVASGAVLAAGASVAAAVVADVLPQTGPADWHERTDGGFSPPAEAEPARARHAETAGRDVAAVAGRDVAAEPGGNAAA